MKYFNLEEVQRDVDKVNFPWIDLRQKEVGVIWMAKVSGNRLLFQIRIDENMQAEVFSGGM